MANVIYSMSSSLDGYIADADGDFNWSAPDAELHAFHNERVGGQSAQLLGRRLYETMLYWEDEDDDWDPVAREFAELWRPLPKIVFSTTLTKVEGNARLATGTLAEELAALDGDVGIGGAGLAAGCFQAGLVDEVHSFVYPVIVGAGTRFLPPVRMDLSLVETRTFNGGVTYAHYRRAH